MRVVRLYQMDICAGQWLPGNNGDAKCAQLRDVQLVFLDGLRVLLKHAPDCCRTDLGALLRRQGDIELSENIVQFPSAGDKNLIAADTERKETGGGGGDDMNTRITNLERDMTEVKVSLGKIETRLGYIETNMLTKGYAAILALVVGLGVFGGGWWIVQQYLAPLVAHIPK